MRNHFILGAVSLAAVAGSSLAFEPYDRNTTTTRPNTTTAPDGKIREQRAMHGHPALVPLDWIIDKNVYAATGDDKLGDVNDLVLNAQTGRVEFVVLGVGGLAGIAETEHLVPWQAFTWDGAARRVRAPLTADKFTNAPKFDSAQFDSFNDTAATPIYSYYGVKRWDNDMTTHGWGERRMTTGARNTRTDGTTTAGYAPRGYVLASKIDDQDLRTADGRDFGDVEELIIDCNSGRLALLIVDVEGEMRADGKDARIALPADAVRLNDQRTLVTNDLDAKLVQTAPTVADNDWADLSTPSYPLTIYRFWSSDPSWLERDTKRDTTMPDTTSPGGRR